MEEPLIHGPEEYGARPGGVPRKKSHAGRVAGIVIAGALLLGAGGGALYAWSRYSPPMVVRDALQKISAREFYGYEGEITIPVGDAEGVARDMISMTMKGEVDSIKKNSSGTIGLRIRSGGDMYTFGADVRAIDKDKSVFFRLNNVPAEVRSLLPVREKDWIKIDANPERLAREMEGLQQMAGGALLKDEDLAPPSQESIDRMRLRIAEVFADPKSFEIVAARPWWREIGRDVPLHYTLIMREEAVYEFINILVEESPAAMGKVLTPEVRITMRDLMSNLRVELWVSSARHTMDRVRLTMAPPKGIPSSPIVFDLALHELDEPPEVDAPASSIDLLQLLMSVWQGAMTGSPSMPGGSVGGSLLIQDRDGDKLSDYDEVMVFHTNPDVKDTDGDGYTDGDEVKNFYNPNGEGLLPSVVGGSITQAQMKSRDEQRLSDIRQMQTALELYYGDHSGYPVAETFKVVGGVRECLGQKGFSADDCGLAYMVKLPANPQPGGEPYQYRAATPASYELIFALEIGAGGFPVGAMLANEQGISTRTGATGARIPSSGFVPSQLEVMLTSEQTQRDQKRIQDIKMIQTSLELYYNDNNGYPISPASIIIGTEGHTCLSSKGFVMTGGPQCTSWGDNNNTVYMLIVPGNPIPGGIPYLYTAVSADAYEIRFALEKGAGGLPAGELTGSPGGIKPIVSSP